MKEDRNKKTSKKKNTSKRTHSKKNKNTEAITLKSFLDNSSHGSKLSEMTFNEGFHEADYSDDEIADVEISPNTREKNSVQRPEDRRKDLEAELRMIQDVWDRVKNKQIDLSLAQVGVQFGEWKPIYDYDLLLELLTQHGYSYNYACIFINSLGKIKSQLSKVIISIDERRSKILSNIKPDEEIMKLMNQLQK